MPARIAKAFNASPNGSQTYARCSIQTIGSCSARNPCHCTSRAPWAMAAARASHPAMTPPGFTRSTAATAIISATVTTVMPFQARTAPSTPRCRNAVAVKDGVMRPPMTVTRISAKLAAASSACRDSDTSPRNRPRWKVALHSHSTSSTSNSGVLRFRSRSKGHARNAARTGRNARSAATTAANGQEAELPIITRPSSHSADSRTSGPPANPRRPVQLGTAVSRNPAIAAQVNPNSISCACHNVGGQSVPRDTPNEKFAAHHGTSTSPLQAAPRKKGRKP